MKRIFISILFTITVATNFLLISKITTINQEHVDFNGRNSHIIDNMPLVTDDPLAVYDNLAPIARRGQEYAKWLSPSVKISNPGNSGSGTIVYYDHLTQYAYVQSCGHLWSGNMSAEEGKQRNRTCKIITWWYNNTHSEEPKTYTAEILYYYNNRGTDISLSRFKADWDVAYSPIASKDYQMVPNKKYHSCGSDHGTESADYEIKYLSSREVSNGHEDYVTTENSPRPGRSGGGLMDEEGYYVGICWGTSSYSGTGNGYFTTLKTIREFNEKEGFGWLNDMGDNPARKLPIIDRNSPQSKYPKDYIPIPNNNYEHNVIWFDK